jgi:RNA polymerase-binding transcription factor DksA
MITVMCRSCDEPIESMWLTANEIATCVDCGGE